jgi:hypothetical protein
MKFVSVLCGTCPPSWAGFVQLREWMRSSRLFLEAPSREAAHRHATSIDPGAVTVHATDDDPGPFVEVP